jgi:hypothetical protein
MENDMSPYENIPDARYHREIPIDEQSVAFPFLVYGNTLVIVPAEPALEEYTSTDR